jgi:hypothetical protein
MAPVCIENFIPFDCVQESHTVGDYGCDTFSSRIAALKQRMPLSDIN